MKIGDLVVSRAHQNYSDIVPAKMVVNVSNRALRGPENPYIVLEDEPEDWKPAASYFVVSPA
jgi:hypothetical protein